MKRENVLVSEDALARQRDFEAKIKAMFAAREAHPVACVDTFGCQQNVADGQMLMGMLADCGFTSPWEIIRHVAKADFHLPAFPLLWLLDLWCRALAGFSLKEADTRKALGSSSLPVLFLHGKEDKFVPVSMTEENYRACRGEKDLYLVPGAAHAQSYGTDTPGCQARIEKLLRR